MIIVDELSVKQVFISERYLNTHIYSQKNYHNSTSDFLLDNIICSS